VITRYQILGHIVTDLLANPISECVPFTQGSKTNIGYRIVWHKGKLYYAHRIALEMKLGSPIRVGYEAAHSCNNRECISPYHLSEKTHKQNMQDQIIHRTANAFRGLRKNNKTGYKGVCCQEKRYVAQFQLNGRTFYLGTYAKAEDAARAYDAAVKRYATEFVNPFLNFPE
jgi:hypothetical protein